MGRSTQTTIAHPLPTLLCGLLLLSLAGCGARTGQALDAAIADGRSDGREDQALGSDGSATRLDHAPTSDGSRVDDAPARDRGLHDAPPIDGGLFPLDLDPSWRDIEAQRDGGSLIERLQLFVEQGSSAGVPLYHLVNVLADGSGFNANSYAQNYQLFPLHIRGLLPRVRDLRHVVQRTIAPPLAVPPLRVGESWFWSFRQRPILNGPVYLGLVAFQRRLVGLHPSYRVQSCLGCSHGDTIALSPSARRIALPRDDGSIVVARDGYASPSFVKLGGGPVYQPTIALSDEALYAVTGGPATTSPHTLWRVPDSGAAQKLPLPPLSDGNTATWVSTTGLAVHRGIKSDLVVFSAARPKAGEGPDDLPREDLFATWHGQPAKRLTESLGRLAGAREQIAISPSGQRVAFVRVESDGWHEILVANTVPGVLPEPTALSTRKQFKHGSLRVDTLTFIDERRLLALLGPGGATSKRHAFLVDVDSGSWQSLATSAQAPFSWSKLPSARVERLWVGPSAKRLALWSEAQAGAPALTVSLVDLATMSSLNVSGAPPSGGVAPQRCGEQGQLLVFRLGQGATDRVHVFDFGKGGALEIEQLGGAGRVSRPHCGVGRRYLAWVEQPPAPQSDWRIELLDTRKLSIPNGPRNVTAVHEQSAIGQLLIGHSPMNVFYTVGSTVKAIPLSLGTKPAVLYSGNGSVILLGSSLTGS